MNSEQASTDPTVPLKDQAAQSGNNHTGELALSPVQDVGPDGGVLAEDTVVVWTPRFIIVFALTLVLGVSAESLFTQGWAIRWFTGTWIFLGHVALISVGWIALLTVTRSRWIGFGAVFGLICLVFITLNIVIQFIFPQPSSFILAHVNVATCLALLGCYICLSIDRLPAGRWDAWFLGLTPIIGIVLVVPFYLLRADRSFFGLENSITLVALILSVLVWWIRPACWRNAPGPTFLFGFVPFIMLILDLVYVSSNSFNFFPVRLTLHASASFFTRETVFFFSQVPLLCLLLGIMRLIKAEITEIEV